MAKKAHHKEKAKRRRDARAAGMSQGGVRVDAARTAGTAEGRAAARAGAAASAAVPAQAPAAHPADAPRPATGDRGVFITFEGGDGVGKSTHIRRLATALKDEGREVLVLREPGGTSVGEMLRSVVLDPANDGLSDEAELLIYEAARAQIVAEVIEPALARGAVVLCDRFADSTVAYQAYGRGLDRAFVDAANAFATRGVMPDRTILLVCRSAADGLVRATARGADRLEGAGAAFHDRVAAGFAAIAEADPERVRVVDSSGAYRATGAAVRAAVADLFGWAADGSSEGGVRHA